MAKPPNLVVSKRDDQRQSKRMLHESQTITIKAYANQRLYNCTTASYVSLEDLAGMVEDEEDFVVIEARTGDDTTPSILKQIILRRANHG
jgi:polyhydroxyalkanoate synthesis regulator protein